MERGDALPVGCKARYFLSARIAQTERCEGAVNNEQPE